MATRLSKRLRRAITERRLLPFIGSGFSKNIAPRFPDWSEVVDRAAKVLKCDPAILRVQGDHLQIAEYVKAKGQLRKLYSTLRDEFEAPNLDVADSKPHQLLPYIDAPWIFTTNWDSWLERSFEHEHIDYSTIVTLEDFAAPRRGRRRRKGAKPLFSPSTARVLRRLNAQTTIVKYHGDFAEPESIVFCASDYYDRLDFEHPLDVKLRSEIVGRAVLFMGYGFGDPNVRYIWHKLTKLMKTNGGSSELWSFFVTPSLNPLAQELFTRMNIEVVPLSPTDITGDLERLMTDIVNLQRT